MNIRKARAYKNYEFLAETELIVGRSGDVILEISKLFEALTEFENEHNIRLYDVKLTRHEVQDVAPLYFYTLEGKSIQ